MAALLIAVSVPAAAQTTIFNTKDFRQDRALWGQPHLLQEQHGGTIARHGDRHRAL
jgi:hypothetical protein